MGHGRLLLLTIITGIVLAFWAGSAAAYEFSGTYSKGNVSVEVGELEERVVGWFSKADQTVFMIDHKFDGQTRRAVVNFQKFYGLTVDGVAGPEVFAKLDRLEQEDRSTKHFDYEEFWQKTTSGCGRRANKYAGTFDGGAVPQHIVKHNVRLLMWRLETVRAKGGGHPIGINSGFRSLRYNACLGGAKLSQHTYGTAADLRMANVTNRRQRDIGRHTQVHGIGCYSSLSHNHFDLRIDNSALPEVSSWWWPDRDDFDRDLADDGRPCWGERKHAARSTLGTPSIAEIDAWEAAGEVPLNGAD